jgi:hypothetical protein
MMQLFLETGKAAAGFDKDRNASLVMLRLKI